MEARFGHDFSGVRVHTDALAARSAGAVSAHAYTVGSHVVFASGRYAPTSREGQRLLAHELTHVVQQEGARPTSSLPIQAAHDPAERAAGAAAESLGSGDVLGARLGTGGATLQRQKATSHSTPGLSGVPAEKYSERGTSTQECRRVLPVTAGAAGEVEELQLRHRQRSHLVTGLLLRP
jgi:hypothetical protein